MVRNYLTKRLKSSPFTNRILLGKSRINRRFSQDIIVAFKSTCFRKYVRFGTFWRQTFQKPYSKSNFDSYQSYRMEEQKVLNLKVLFSKLAFKINFVTSELISICYYYAY